jgi:predicted NBD/HSP70 family sugar kinase
MAIGVPGSADETGTVLAAPSVGWVGVDLAAQLSVALGDPTYPITVHGSADLGAAAECQLGAHAGSANLVYLTGTAAISAGVVADGRSLRGEQGFAGEIGHLQLDPSGPRCRCGRRGCLEALAGVSEIVRRVTAADGPAMPPDDLTTEVDEVVRLAKAADGRTLDVLADAGAWLGRAAAALANIVNPEVVVLGGYFARLAPWVLPAARDAVVAGTYPAEPTRISLAASTLGARATVYGGVIHVLDAVDVDDLSVATGHASH